MRTRPDGLRHEAQFGVIVLIMWFLLMPKGLGIHYATFLILGLTAAWYAYVKRDQSIGKCGELALLLIAGYAAIYVLSFLMNYGEIRKGALFELARPAYMSVMLMLGYHAAGEITEKKPGTNKIIAALKLSIGVSVVAALFQLHDPLIFDWWWSAQKTSGLDSHVRLTGTMYNPNAFAFFVSFCALGVYAYTRNKEGLVWLVVAFMGVMLSGSRTMIVAFPLAALSLMIIAARTREINRPVSGPATFLLAASVVVGLAYLLFADRSFYLFNDIEKVLTSRGLLGASAFTARYEHLSELYVLWKESGSTGFLFGLGSIPELRVGDNEFVAGLFRLGGVGVVIFVLIYAFAFRVGWSARDHWLGKWLLSAFFMILIAGLTMEFLQSWAWVTLIFLLIGMVVFVIDNNKNQQPNDDNPSHSCNG